MHFKFSRGGIIFGHDRLFNQRFILDYVLVKQAKELIEYDDDPINTSIFLLNGIKEG